jgi:hypothetical protein
VIGALSAAVLWLQAVSPPSAAFAFAGPGGSHLIVWDEVANPRALTRATCAGGRSVKVDWLRHQTVSERFGGRQIASEFAQMAGDVFRTSAPLAADDVCLLSGDAFTQGWKAQDVRGDGGCSPATRTRLEAAHKRAVTGCWYKGEVGGWTVALAEFAPQGKSMLASLAVVGPDTLSSLDFPAEADDDRFSCWRVDDGCTLAPKAFELLFGYLTADGRRGLLLAWHGAESQALSLLETDGARLRERLQSSRYWSP